MNKNMHSIIFSLRKTLNDRMHFILYNLVSNF